MSLRDELDADRRPGGPSCTVCLWLTEQKPAGPDDDLGALMQERTPEGTFRYGHRTIWRAMKARGYPHGDKPIESHRGNGHGAAGA